MRTGGYHFKLKTQLPSKNEEKRFGIFISHASADKNRVEELCEKMRTAKLTPLQDGDFIHGGQNFHEQIHDCIKCYGCVIIVTKAALASDWVAYECGYFSQSGNPVVLWDPDNVLSLRPSDKKSLLEKILSPKNNAMENLLNFHLTQYLPVCHTADQVVEQLQHLSAYAELYTDACLEYSVEAFRDDLARNVSTAMVYLSSDMLSGKGDLFKECKLSTLVVNFGMNYANHGDGIHCWAKRTLNMDGSYTADEECLLADGVCPYSKGKCAMYSQGKIDHDRRECVILNHVIPSGRYFDKGEKYYNNQILDSGMMVFYVPVHKLYGTEFKFIIDAPSQAKHAELMRLFAKMGMDPTASDSLNGWRIYLSLPDFPYQGFFHLEHLFHNNFLCPRAATNPEERT